MFIPLAIISSKLGYLVDWNGKEQTVIIDKNGEQIQFKIGNNSVHSSTGSTTLDVAPFISNDRTYVPMSGLFKTLKFDVQWKTTDETASHLNIAADTLDRGHYVVVITDPNVKPTASAADLAHEEWVKANYVAWGLGTNLIDYEGNNRPYDWYINQADTGVHNGNNCGPSSAVMMAKWINPNFTETAETARSKYLLEGGWWYTNTITAYYESMGIDYKYLNFNSENRQTNIDTLKRSIKNGEISLLCTEIGNVPYSTDPTRINRFYVFDGGHFLVVKGYVEVDDKTYFEVYDPNNWDFYYTDGAPMGRDRYYEANALMTAVEVWWPYTITVSEPK